MIKNGKRNAAIVGLGAVVACAVCLVPLAVPVLLGAAGIGAIGAQYWVIGGVLVAVAGVLGLRKMGWLRSSGRECCGPE